MTNMPARAHGVDAQRPDIDERRSKVGLPGEDRWQWDWVTWSVILLVVVGLLFFVTILWPHPWDGR